MIITVGWGANAGWACIHNGHDPATIWRISISALSDWAVGNLVGLTAVTVQDLTAQSGGPTLWVLAGVIAVSMIVVARHTRRRRA